MKLEIVSHCWQERYARMLTYQLSSLVLYPPRCVSVVMTVFFTAEDRDTAEVIRYFQATRWPDHVVLRPWQLPRERLLTREIGRNLAALASEADWVWFTDCDYCFRSGTLDALTAAVAPVDGPLVFPKQFVAHRTLAHGDRAIERARGAPRILDVPEEAFIRKQCRRAIGGVQIARGDIVRRIGYCKSSRRQQRRATTWQPETGDIHFRRNLGTQGQPIELPNLFRIRHSGRGSDKPVMERPI